MHAHHIGSARLICLSIVMLCFSQFSHAQNVDVVAPVIELEELRESPADRSQVFTAQVKEDQKLRDVTLYYRRSGQLQTPFTPAPMEVLSDTGYYSVSIPTDYNDLRAIEYYIQAQDETGNRTVSGFAFDPYKRTLTKAPLAIGSTGSDEMTTVTSNSPRESRQPLLQRRWVQITLGVLAAGAIASLASGGGGDDSEVVPLTFNLQ